MQPEFYSGQVVVPVGVWGPDMKLNFSMGKDEWICECDDARYGVS